MTTRITTDNITDATIGTADLASSVPLNTQWQSVKTSDFTAVAGEGYFVDTTSAAVEVTLPASPSAGDTVVLKDYARTWATNNVTIASVLTDGSTSENTFSTNGQTVTLVYMDGTKGWSLINEDTTSELNVAPTYITATGGTITTSGDYKIHTFTGDGCFVVSTTGNAPLTPLGGPDIIDYLVIAGGGGTGFDKKQAGGAGGYRESSGAASGCYTVNPRNTSVPGIAVSATTYPVTVGGGGGPGGPPFCSPVAGGSSSIFSTITSTGGGAGSPDPLTSTPLGSDGGSGGSYGAGNTPPVIPAQGFSGLNAPAGGTLTGGAGGAGAAATNGSGGAGATSGITGSDVVRASGGGGGDDQPNPTPAATPGGGGKGGRRCGPCGTSGSANTGGGGGGSGANSPGFGGGKGLVVIRYKYQN